ncbi:MAG TPA: carboxypeptidase-like regulatory domain-containing protein, partial [Vicinamibacteria bacterium]|nr:carboxypeptidase-like regulatory domain-containing protein [Vicinamibacteria bacterium]
MRRTLILALALLIATAPGAFAQISGGNIYGTVTDESGAVLPGAAIALTSDLGARNSTTGSQGEFRFLNLDRGRYKISVSLAGFSTVNREVNVVTGENVNLTFNMKVAQVAETVTVTAETPLVDIKRRGTSTTLTTDELQK